MKKCFIDLESYLSKNAELFDNLTIELFCNEFKTIFNCFSKELIENVVQYNSINVSFVKQFDAAEDIAEQVDNYIFAVKHNKIFKNPIENLITQINDDNYLLWMGVFFGCIKNSDGYKARRKIDVLEHTDYEIKSVETFINYFKYCCLLAYNK